jgi:hypothetical protein
MKTQQGLIKIIVIIVIAVLILSFLGIDIKQAIESPTTKHNFSYITQAILWVWNSIILPIIHTLQALFNR